MTNRFTTDRGARVIDMLQWRAATNNDRDSIVAAPRELFVDAAARDYRLLENSPARAGASYRTPAVDLGGNSRSPRQSDIGAYQRTGAQAAIGKELDRDGPQLVHLTPSGEILPPLASFRLQFSESLRRDTLSEQTVRLAGPDGAIRILEIEPGNVSDYLVKFAPLKIPGPYALVLDARIQDPAGNPLNQIGNGAAGQKEVSQFIVRFQIMESYKFSFGPRTTPAAQWVYSHFRDHRLRPNRGFGWLNGGIKTVDTGAGSAETRTLAYGPLAHFNVDVPAGDYDVTLTMGNSKFAHDQMALSLQRAPPESIDTAVGHFHVKTYRLTVANGKLDLLLRDLGGSDPNVVINSLIVVPILDASSDGPASFRQERP